MGGKARNPFFAKNNKIHKLLTRLIKKIKKEKAQINELLRRAEL